MTARTVVKTSGDSGRIRAANERRKTRPLLKSTYPAQELWERQKHEENIAAINRLLDKIGVCRQQDQTDDKKKACREIVTIIVLFLAFGATVVGDFVFYCTMIHSDAAALDQLTLAYPPRIHVGSIHIWEKGKGELLGARNVTPALKPGMEIQGGVLATNYGRETATVIASDCLFYWTSKPLSVNRPFFARKTEPHWNKLGPDGHWDIPIKIMRPGVNAGWIISTTVDRPGDTLFVLGLIVYEDRLHTRRTVLFAQKYDPISDNFIPVKDNPDYESEG